jgi:hypothetical protein
MLRSIMLLIVLTVPSAAQSSELKYGPLPYRAVNANTWVLIEIWSTVGDDITLSAYFMDATSRKNERLRDATKRSPDHTVQFPGSSRLEGPKLNC